MKKNFGEHTIKIEIVKKNLEVHTINIEIVKKKNLEVYILKIEN